MLVRPSTFIAGVLAGAGTAEPRWRFGAKAIQVYSPGGMFWSKKSLILRNAPYTIEAPHLGQIQTRIQFGEAARAAKGSKGFVEGLPAVAAAVKRAMSGFRAPDAMRPEDYPSKKFHTVHTLEELKRMEREKRAKARVPGPVTPGPLPP